MKTDAKNGWRPEILRRRNMELKCSVKDCAQKAETIMNGNALCLSHWKSMNDQIDKALERQRKLQEAIANIDAPNKEITTK